jgi:DNA-binding GntR family transcriptional regulator
MNLSDKLKSVTDISVEFIKERLQKGELKPGDRIDEKQLSEQLGVSRTPIREALIRLKEEGLVEILPRREIRVKKLRGDDIRDIYETVGILESEAAVKALPKITQAEITKMHRLMARMKAAYERDDFQKYLDINLDLHNVHTELCGNALVVNLITAQKKRLYDLPRRISNAKQWVAASIDDHARLIAAFEAGDGNMVRKILRDVHWGPDRMYHLIGDDPE